MKFNGQKASKVTDGYLKRQAAKKMKGTKITPPTDEKLPDGTRKYKMFKETDEESAEAVKMSRFLLRFIDRNMLDAMIIEQDENDEKSSQVAIYARDEDKGDFVFTINAAYISTSERDDEEIREEKLSLNEVNEGDHNKSKED